MIYIDFYFLEPSRGNSMKSSIKRSRTFSIGIQTDSSFLEEIVPLRSEAVDQREKTPSRFKRMKNRFMSFRRNIGNSRKNLNETL